MLTVRAITNGAGYAAKHLSNNDYYSEGEQVEGRWFGKGAARLGLAGAVKSADFERVREGQHPETGEFLRPRHSADRTQNGEVKTQARHLYDFVFSAPKSVSVLAQVGGDHRLVEAHRTAVNEALAELEGHAATRVRKAGLNEDRTTGNVVVALYQHDTSRELDPQLHAHAVAANLTWDPIEGRWKALQARGLYTRASYLTEVYRNALAREVLTLGYRIERRHDAATGLDAGFEIAGVSANVLEIYSQRSAQRDEAVSKFVREKGRNPTNNEVAVLVRETRPAKLTEISTAEVRQKQRQRLEEGEGHQLQAVRGSAIQVPLNVLQSEARTALAHAEAHLFERVTVAPDHELFAEALRWGRGRIHLAELRRTLSGQEQTGAAMRHKDDIATQESLERERALIGIVDRGVGKHGPLGSPAFKPDPELTPEQNHAVRFVLDSKDVAVELRGAAGTGKTRALLEVRRGIVATGRELLAVAPGTSAVEVLRDEGFRDAVTLARLLADPQMQESVRGKAILLDEASLVSAGQMLALLELAERQSARVVLSGDTRQLHSVDAGDALRILERESKLRSVALTKVRRQRSEPYRKAVEALRLAPGTGFDALQAMGAIKTAHLLSRADAVQHAYTEAVKSANSVLVVAATHDELEAITGAIRAARQDAGELTGAVTVERDAPLNFTMAQKRDVRNYNAGQRLIFHKRVAGVRKGEVIEVLRVENGKVIGRTASAGAERIVTSDQAAAFDVFERKQMEVAPGDRLLLLTNRREPGFRAINGDLATIASVEAGTIRLEDGRTLPADYRQIDYGYAITTHRSQGKTVDAVVISADRMRRELFYVAATRARVSLTVVTSDPAGLRQSIAQSDSRESATELRQRMGPAEGARRAAIGYGI